MAAMYYRLTNNYKGPSWSLDVDGENRTSLKLAATGNYSGQYWKLVPIPTQPGKFYLRTSFTGDECVFCVFCCLTYKDFRFRYSLDIINDGQNITPQMAPTANVTGQMWTFT